MLLRALADEGHRVSLLSFGEPAELTAGPSGQLRALFQDVHLVAAPAPPGPLAYLDRLRTLASPLPYGVHRFASEPMKRAIRDALTLTPFDCVICDDIYTIKNIGECGRTPLLLNKHDITHVILRRFLHYQTNPLAAAYAWAEYLKLRRWERWACRAVSGVLTCSGEDRRVLSAIAPDTPMAIVPNVIDADSYVPVPDTESPVPTVLYVGAMDWYPNLDAVNFFIKEILPDLQRQVPSVRFRVAGRSPAAKFRRRFIRLPNVTFTGTVQDIRTEIARATVCVVPLRIGSGTRLKILEAGAMEKAIVSTQLGAEGLDFVHRDDILLADEPRPFAAAVAALLTDAGHRRKLGEAARRRVERSYSTPSLRSAIRNALSLITQPPSRSAAR
jgi:glycosyltransferase involved in cell wall biosynthesis